MTIIRAEYDGVIYDLDVLDESPIRVDISAIENSDIGEVFGAASQTFTLPGSKKNNRFFKHAYKVGVDAVPGLGESVRASVISRSDTLLQGSLFLNEVVKTANGGITYEVIITNDVVTFTDTVQSVSLQSLDWSDLNHTFSEANITGSWTDNLFSGSILYPLVDFGSDGIEPTGSVPLVAIDPSGSVGYMNNSGSALQVQQFYPSVRVSTVLDKIFEFGDFSYTSSIQSELDNLYVLPRETDTLSVKGAGFSDYGFIVEGASAQIVPANTANATIEFPTETYDPTNSFNTTTFQYTVPRAGSYVIQAEIVFAFASSLVDGTVDIEIRKQAGGFLATDTRLFSGTYGGLQTMNLSTSTTEGEYVYLEQGEVIYMTLSYSAISPNDPNLTLLNYSTFQTLLTPINYSTGTIQMDQQFDPQTKCIDFIKGLLQKLNLVMEPVYSQNRVLKIEPYNTWIDSGKTADWTYKVAQADRIGLKSPMSSQQKTLVFQDEKDNDKLSKQVIENVEGYQWGTEVVEATSDVPQGERKIGTYFAPTILERIQGGGTYNVIPQLYKTDDAKNPKKTFKHKPRLGYKITGSLNTTCYFGVNADPFTDYATISNYNALPIVSGSTKNLHFNDTYYQPTFSSTTGSITTYESNWQGYITDLYRSDNKILSAQLEFNPEDLINIELNDKIFVEDNWYRINNISGFNLVHPDVVNVELISLNYQPTASNCEFTFDTALYTTTTTTTAAPTTTTTTTTAAPTTTTTTTTTAAGPFAATGGVTGSFVSGGVDYTYHEFTASSQVTDTSFELVSVSGTTSNAQIVLIAGGGGGGVVGTGTLSGGGGGAGQVIRQYGLTLSYPNNYGGNIAAGGKGGDPNHPTTPYNNGESGGDTYINIGGNITANGGEGGHGNSSPFLEADGGDSADGFTGGLDAGTSVGGGGAGSTANGGNANGSINDAGNGGDGELLTLPYTSPSLGTSPIAVAGGGGGGNAINNDNGVGAYGGGNGADSATTAQGGARFSGAGAGGGLHNATRGADGGDGIVIVIYPTN